MLQASRGKTAFDAGKYEDAIVAYTAAIEEHPESPIYHIQRATAYQRIQKYAEALNDAERAVVFAQKRASRENIIEAQIRRGCALYGLGRYGDAQFVFGVVEGMKKDHKTAGIWKQKTALALNKLADDDQNRQCTVEETPVLEVLPTSVATTAPKNKQIDSPVPVPSTAKPSRLEQIRHEWYQNTQSVYVTILAKGVRQDSVAVDIKEHALSVAFPTGDSSTYDFSIEPLFAAVQPEACISRVLQTKIEIILVKAVPGQKWPALEGVDNAPAQAQTQGEDESSSEVKRAVTTKPASAPSYPTSSRSGPKNWDKVVADLRNSDKGKEGGAADDDDDDAGGDPANSFFKKLFKDASPDMQRAMIKSYTESNGTALSTNWDEVSKGKVETAPPDGMEAKTW